jgi:hypothetical protein
MAVMHNAARIFAGLLALLVVLAAPAGRRSAN